MKKLTYFLILLLFLFPSHLVHADNGPDIHAKAAILVDGTAGEILYERNSDLLLPVASMSKMMTEYIILEQIKNGRLRWDQEVSVSDYAYEISRNTAFSNVMLNKNKKYTLRGLFEAMAIYSANGAAICLAELAAGTESNFAALMNHKAEELDLTDYQFVNSTGLPIKKIESRRFKEIAPVAENKMSALDCAKIAYRLIHDFPEILKITATPKKAFQNERTVMMNWNWMLPTLIYYYEGVDGLKTGSTDTAGYCFTATAQKKGIRFISVIIGADSYEDRFRETKKLLDDGYQNYFHYTIIPKDFKLNESNALEITGGYEEKVSVHIKNQVSLLIKKGEEHLYEIKYQPLPSLLTRKGILKAPIKKDQTLGFLAIEYHGTGQGYLYEDLIHKAKAEVLAAAEVKKADIFTLLFRFLKSFFSSLFNK
jgi:D-alanyl-D-alanine carboxypeptidase (penicillin-binding protein 5/6)